MKTILTLATLATLTLSTSVFADTASNTDENKAIEAEAVQPEAPKAE